MRKSLKIILAIIFLVVLVFQTPAIAAKNKKNQSNVNNIQEKLDYININWWDNFSDPYLKSYVLLAINNNHELKKASWKIEEYRQNVKTVFSRELPSLSVGGNYFGVKFPEASSLNFKNNIFAIPFQMNYEADIFLKNHDKTKSAKKGYEASKLEEKSVYISLASDVSTVYLNILKFDKQILLQEKIVLIKKEKLKRDENRYTRGVISASILNNTKKEVQSAKNSLEDLKKTRDKALTQLAVLIGESPDNICKLQRTSLDNFEYRKNIPSCISSDAIFSRPDVLATEKKLEKAKIDIRVARKEFLPTFNVTGLFALSNIGPTGFGSWKDTLAAIAVGSTLDLFRGGYKIANLKIYKSRYEQMFEEYKQVDLTALKEIADSLMVVKEDTIIDTNTIKSLEIQKDNYKRAKDRYKQGVISYLQFLTDEENYIVSQQNQVNSKTNRLINYLTLYKAVGGKL